MVRRFLTYFLFEDYVPHTRHIIYPILMLAVGYKSVLDYDWVVFGITLFILGILLALAIIIGIGWRGPIEYWKQIEQTTQVMLRIKDPKVWYSLGYNKIPDTIRIEETKTDGAFFESFTKKLPVSPATMNAIANTVLFSQDTSFTEQRYNSKIPAYRKTLKALKKDGYVVKETSHPKSRHIFTRKGMELVYQYADKELMLQVKKEGEKNASNKKQARQGAPD